MSKYKTDLFISYDDAKFFEDILSKKEYNIYSNIKNVQEDNLLFNIEPKIRENNILQLQSYQIFVRNFLNPDTPYNRLLIKWEVGMGKTLAALSIAFKFIQLYKKRYLVNENDDKIGKVYIVGYTKKIFIQELLKFQEFGFMRRTENIQKHRLIEQLKKNPHDIYLHKQLEELMNIVKRRIKNKNIGGFFEFFTYKELVKRLYIFDAAKVDIHKLSEDQINNEIKNGKIEIDKEFMSTMKNSLIICDEVHNIYNSVEKNNWGIAMQTILNMEKTVKALFLSATPITHNPSEIIDLLSLLNSKKIELHKKDFFNSNEELLPEALDKISQLSIGRVSFLKDMNPKYFAKKRFVGEEIKDIEYLKFMRCPMSEIQYNTYKILEKEENLLDISHLLDIVIPNPDDEKIGIFKTSDIKHKIQLSSKDWKQKYGIDFIGDRIKGNIMLIENIKLYSNKYYTLYNTIIDIIKNNKGKIFIYHKYVYMFGIFFIEDFLIKNGFIKYGTNPGNTSLCLKCLTQFGKHENIDHEFVAIKMISVHGEISDKQLDEELNNVFNNKNNIYGDECFILIGSKKIQESYNLDSVRNVIIMSKPVNMSIFNQIIGRALRKKAHVLLPFDQQNVDIYIFVSSHPNLERLLYEELDYKKSIKRYITIQKIEKILHQNAIDVIINKDIIWTKDIINNYEKSDEIKFSMLKYDMPETKSYTLPELDTTIYNVYYNQDEIDFIKMLIKRLFIQISRIWDYELLWSNIKNPPFNVDVNTELFSEEIFIIALTYLTWNSDLRYVNNTLIKRRDDVNLYTRIFDPNDKIIIMPNNIRDENVICQIGKHYILFPINDRTKKPMIDVEFPFRSERKIIYKNITLNNIILSIEKTKSNVDIVNEIFKIVRKNTDLNKLDFLREKKYEINIILLERTLEYFYSIINGKPYEINNLDIFAKLLLYYNLHGVIIWLGSIDITLITNFAKYHEKNSHKNIKSEILKKLNVSKYKGLDKDLFKNTYSYYCSEYYINLSDLSKQYNDLLYDILMKTYNNKKDISIDIIPIGYILTSLKLLDPIQGWTRYLHINNYTNFVENNKIVGYMIYDNDIKFKIRPPLKQISIPKDHRLIEKGIVCNTKSKSYLLKIIDSIKEEKGGYDNDINDENIGGLFRKRTKKIKVDDITTYTIKGICELLKINILWKQIESYNKEEKIRWFYMLSEME